jgi:HAD superfamily hydrolase (TIGR01509 family)
LDTVKIQHVIFDLGGVIVNIDPQLTARAFADLSETDPVDIMELHKTANFFTAYETGKISDEQFRDEIRRFLKKDIPDDTIDQAWGALLLDIPREKVQMLARAKERYNTYLLSNTNHIHRLKFCRTFREMTGRKIEDYFKKVYYSYEMGKRKPDKEIFMQVMDENLLIPSETLLIDDSLPNIVTARSLGLLTLHVERNQLKIDFKVNGR